MNYLSVAGLSLDLTGVLLLGADVVRIQLKLRREAEDRIASLNEVFEGKENLEKWVDDLTRNADWREYERTDEGYRAIGGTFDPTAARDSVSEIAGQVSDLGTDIGRLAQLQIASATADQATAGISLVSAYVGLGMIVVGFALQIIALL